MNWTLFHQHIFPIRHKLYRVALRITGSVQEAEDVVQEILERVWKNGLDQRTAVQNWEAWCVTMTRNLSVDKTRRQVNRRTAPLDTAVDQAAETINPQRAAESNDMIDQIRRLMQELPEKQRLVMHLRDIEECTYEEIAQVLNISLEQVKVTLHRARKGMREKLSIADHITSVDY